jgi:hypothetical protein
MEYELTRPQEDKLTQFEDDTQFENNLSVLEKFIKYIDENTKPNTKK